MINNLGSDAMIAMQEIFMTKEIFDGLSGN